MKKIISEKMIPEKPKLKTVLSIAGSDSCGGAGIQADIKTITVNGAYAMSAVTALTAQNTKEIKGVYAVTPDFLKMQLQAVFEDIFPDSVKIGMLGSKEIVDVTVDMLKLYNVQKIVVDPVMVATCGDSLVCDGEKLNLDNLLSIATVITPNIPEGEVLSGIKIKNKDDMIKAAKSISEKYKTSVLLKGGHIIEDENLRQSNDLLYDAENNKIIWFNEKRIDTLNTHGTGCTLSACIAVYLAKGYNLEDAINNAKAYVTGAMSAGLDIGKGSGPLMHNFNI